MNKFYRLLLIAIVLAFVIRMSDLTLYHYWQRAEKELSEIKVPLSHNLLPTGWELIREGDACILVKDDSIDIDIN